MVGELVLHIGDHKTATTSIQEALARGAVPDMSRRLLYPPVAGVRAHHNHLARAIRNRKAISRREAYFTELAARLSESPLPKAALSGEGFERARPEAVAETLAHYLPELAGRVRVIAYVRPHAERILASYAETIKQGLFAGELDAYVESRLKKGEFAYAPRFAAWREVFGDRLTLRPMIRSELTAGCVLHDFLARVFPGEGVVPERVPRANPTPSVEDLAVLRALQTRLAGHVTRKGPERSDRDTRESARTIGWRLARLLSHTASGAGTRLALDARLAERVAAAYADDAAALDAAFFEGAPMSDALAAAPARAVAQPQRIAAESQLAPEARRQLGVWLDLVEAMYRRDPSGWAAHFKANPLVLSG